MSEKLASSTNLDKERNMNTPHEVTDPWEGVAVGADFDWHKQNGYDGGTDNKVGPDKPVYAATSGWATAMHDVTNGVLIGMPSGAHVGQLENKKLTGKFPRQVKLGDQIAVTGLVRPNSKGKPVLRWPHTDWRKANGVRDDIHHHVTLKKKQRRAKVVINVRPYPNTTHAPVGSIAAGDIVTASAWVPGEEISGSALWYKVPGGYASAVLFTTVTKYGLSKGKAPVEPVVEPPAEAPVVETPVIVEPEPEDPPVVSEPTAEEPVATTPVVVLPPEPVLVSEKPAAPVVKPNQVVGSLVVAVLITVGGLLAAVFSGLFR
jgi:hypothetical protein